MLTDKIPKRCQCDDCKTKLTLTSFPCRCGKYFCSLHQNSESHKCTFDYRAEAKKELLKTLSTPIVGEKVAII